MSLLYFAEHHRKERSDACLSGKGEAAVWEEPPNSKNGNQMTERLPESGEQTISKEIERKFVIHSLPPEFDLNQFEATKIDQGYLAVDDKAAVRIRRKGNKYFITYKAAPASHSAERIELESPLSEDQFKTLWPGTEGRRVEKTRYHIPFGDHLIELDVFEGENKGKMLAEVEFPNTQSADVFQVPAWFGLDVTADKRFGNASIADHGFPTA